MIIPHLRLVITNNCNYNCYFCHKEGFNSSNVENLNFKTILDISTLAKKYNISKIRITGGEPLLRKDILDIIKGIFELNPTIDLSLTTNGYYLEEYAHSLYSMGIKRINVSLVSLDMKRYKQITGVDGLAKVIRGIKKARNVGISISLNVIIMKQNIIELKDFIAFCKENDINLRLLDILPTDKISKENRISLSMINKLIKEIGYKSHKKLINNTLVNVYDTKKIKIVTKVKSFRNECTSCVNKDKCGEGIYALRLNPYGKLQPCLYKDETILNFEGLESNIREENFIKAFEIVGGVR